MFVFVYFQTKKSFFCCKIKELLFDNGFLAFEDDEEGRGEAKVGRNGGCASGREVHDMDDYD